MAAALILSSVMQFLNWAGYGGPTTIVSPPSTQGSHVMSASGYGGPTT